MLGKRLLLSYIPPKGIEARELIEIVQNAQNYTEKMDNDAFPALGTAFIRQSSTISKKNVQVTEYSREYEKPLTHLLQKVENEAKGEESFIFKNQL